MIRRRGVRRAVLLGLVTALLAGCMARGPEVTPLRNPNAPMSSQVDVTAARLAGNWVVRRSWVGAPYLSGEVRLGRTATGLRLSGRKLGMGAANRAAFLPFVTTLRPAGPGRFDEAGGKVFGGAALWVLWLDADNRTAAIGTPDGEFGWIMDRKAAGGADRIRAAGEIMEWMGYDLKQAQGGQP